MPKYLGYPIRMGPGSSPASRLVACSFFISLLKSFWKSEMCGSAVQFSKFIQLKSFLVTEIWNLKLKSFLVCTSSFGSKSLQCLSTVICTSLYMLFGWISQGQLQTCPEAAPALSWLFTSVSHWPQVTCSPDWWNVTEGVFFPLGFSHFYRGLLKLC